MIEDITNNPFGSSPLTWLSQQEYIALAEMPRRTCSRMAKEGRIWGTQGRAVGRHADPWPILLCPKLEKDIQERLDTLRRQRVMGERKASLTPLSTIVDGADAVRVGLWTMAQRRTIDRLTGPELMRLEKALREPARSLFDLHNAVESRMKAAGITLLG